jgi:hypothetical protein
VDDARIGDVDGLLAGDETMAGGHAAGTEAAFPTPAMIAAGHTDDAPAP